uniref:MYM-type domain-containing protein n=1 Tax=viral metagenome TaxID=1070528 RepID=A0A6C0IE13_9ZZZZ
MTSLKGDTTIPSKKRGRKPKKNIVEENNITVLIEDAQENQKEEEDNKYNNLINTFESDNLMDTNIQTFTTLNEYITLEEPKQGGKKRGRKPKGGKIIPQIVPINNIKDSKPNVILHLKCSLKDLQSNSLLNSNIQSFNFNTNKNDNSYEIICSNDVTGTDDTIFKQNITNDIININTNNTNTFMKATEEDIEYEEDEPSSKSKENDIKEVWKKLKILEHNLHINNISDKKSACFWCTYEFDNPPVYIPKHYIKESYHVYGCFCSPECATAYLMEENIDSSSKFERYHLINHIYAKIYDYEKNIKPAPNPYYMLEKYYGNLNIQEYRALLKNERLFLVVDKPLTRILPELHEDNDDFIINNKIIPSNTYQIKKKLQKKHLTKKNILNEKFGLAQQ